MIAYILICTNRKVNLFLGIQRGTVLDENRHGMAAEVSKRTEKALGAAIQRVDKT